MEAVDIAKQAFTTFYPSEKFQRLMLEELEESADTKCWIITLGYDDPGVINSVQRRILAGLDAPRSYKSFTIDKETGHVRAMKVRKVA